MKKIILFLLILGSIFVISDGDGAPDAQTHLGIQPTLGLMPDAKLNAISKCLEEGKDCQRGEILAIFNKSKVPKGTNPNVEALNVGLSKVPGKFSFKVISAYPLPSVMNPNPKGSQVCGQTLLRIKFGPEAKELEVNEAIKILNGFVSKQSSTSLVQKATLYGIQPDGYGKPGGSTEETNPKGSSSLSADYATKVIGRQNLQTKPIAKTLVTVAVLDTGWLQSANIKNTGVFVHTFGSSLNRNFVDLDNKSPLDVFDDFEPSTIVGHGTSVTSIIGSNDPQTGVSPNAEISTLKICNRAGDCNESSAIMATCYAASPAVQASIINMSFGGRLDTASPPRILQTAINDATYSGSLVIAAAGNTRSEKFKMDHPNSKGNDPVYPAIFSLGHKYKKITKENEVEPGSLLLSVGATFSNTDYAKFATTNSSIDLSAPGSWLRTLGSDGKIYQFTDTLPIEKSGTSFSAAYVSGAAALLIGLNKQLDKPQMRPWMLADLILSTVNTDGCKPKSEDGCGKGLLNVGAAWKKLGGP